MSTAAERMRRSRELAKNGRAVLMVEVDLFELSEGLIKHGLLGAWDQENREAITRAAERALALLSTIPVARNGG